MFSQEFMRNALIAGTAVALTCGVCGWFVVLRGQVFAGDALSHVAIPGALAAAAAGIDERVGLFVATVAVGAGIGLLGAGAVTGRAGRAAVRCPPTTPRSGSSSRSSSASGSSSDPVRDGTRRGSGILAPRTLFGSIFGLRRGLRCWRRGSRWRSARHC